MTKIQNIINRAGGTAALVRKLNIGLSTRTVEKWKAGTSEPPEWVIKLIVWKLR
jgi:hypothetical protein